MRGRTAGERRRRGLAALLLMAVAPGLLAQGLSVEFFPEGGEGAHPITIHFDGELYARDLWFGAGLDPGPELTPAERAMVEVVAINRDGSQAELLEIWHPAERAALGEMIGNPDLYRSNQQLYQRMGPSAFVARVLYGASYVLFFIQHSRPGVGDFIKVYPLVHEGERYFLTNRLQGDEVYQYFSTAFAEGLTLKQQPQSNGS